MVMIEIIERREDGWLAPTENLSNGGTTSPDISRAEMPDRQGRGWYAILEYANHPITQAIR